MAPRPHHYAQQGVVAPQRLQMARRRDPGRGIELVPPVEQQGKPAMVGQLHEMLRAESAEGVTSRQKREEILTPVRPFAQRHQHRDRLASLKKRAGQLNERRRLARAWRRDNIQDFGGVEPVCQAFDRNRMTGYRPSREASD